MDYPPRTECPVLGYAVDAMPSSRQMRMFAPIAAGFVLVDTEGWFWIRTLARRGTATLVMANCTSRLARVPRSRPLSRDRTRCPRCPASRGTTRCRHRQAVVARVPRRARPVVRIRPQVRPGALHPRAGADPHVKMQPILDDLAFGNALEEQSRAH